MGQYLYRLVEWIAEVHSELLRLNDAYEYHFTDKELHFLIIGALGMLMIFVVYPIFKWLAGKNHVMVISWIYVFTLIIVITFAIEIGQRVTNTGVMEFADIMFGVVGFICMFLVFSAVRGVWHLIKRLIGNRRELQRRGEKTQKSSIQPGVWTGPDRRNGRQE